MQLQQYKVALLFDRVSHKTRKEGCSSHPPTDRTSLSLPLLIPPYSYDVCTRMYICAVCFRFRLWVLVRLCCVCLLAHLFVYSLVGSFVRLLSCKGIYFVQKVNINLFSS